MLHVGKADVVEWGEFIVHKILHLAVSADHSVDGVTCKTDLRCLIAHHTSKSVSVQSGGLFISKVYAVQLLNWDAVSKNSNESHVVFSLELCHM